MRLSGVTTDLSQLNMKNGLIAVSAFLAIFGSIHAFAEEAQANMPNHPHEMPMADARTSLGLSPQMKQHQLAIMREHLEAITTIAALIAENKFDEASKIAHAKLGLTPEMKAMCMMMHSEKFTILGMAFHESGDNLGDMLQTGNVNESLRALNKTMQFCVDCHATFRQ